MISEMQFLDFIITKIDYKVMPLDGNTDKENSFQFAYGLNKAEEIHTLALLTNIVSIQEDHKLEIEIETKGRFLFDEKCELDDEQKISIIKTNGSAIIFPYVRSLVYNLTSADTHGKSVVLPTINFNRVIQNIDSNSEEPNSNSISEG